MSRLIACPHCGHEISSTAKTCPHCGGKKPFYKRIGFWFFIVFIGLIIISASTNEIDENISQNESSVVVQEAVNNEESEIEIVGAENKKNTVGDAVTMGDYTVTLVDVSENEGKDFYFPEDGKIFLICEFNIENNSNQDIAVSSLLSFEAYIDDYATTMDFSAEMASGKSQLDGTVAAGKKMNGAIGYSVDKDWSELEIRFCPDFWSGKDIIFTVSK